MKRHLITFILAVLYIILITFGIHLYFKISDVSTLQKTALQKTELILYNWNKADVLTIEPELDAMLAKHREWIKNRLNQGTPYTWENFVLPINEMTDELHQLWYPIVHVGTVTKPEKVLKERSETAYSNCEKKITEYSLEISQSKTMYDAYRLVRDNAESTNLSPEQIISLDNKLRDYRLSGILLQDEKKQELAVIAIKTNELSKKFEENATYSQNSWKKHLANKNDLLGLPDAIISSAKEAAKKMNKKGFVLDLGDDTISTVLQFAKNRDLREEIYHAIFTIASKNGPGGKKFDNTPIIDKILRLRHQEAKLLGFDNYAELALSTRMAKNTKEVTDFMGELKTRSHPFAEKQFRELSEYARKKDGLQKIEPWDIQYYQQMMKKEKFSFSEEDVRPYFPLTKVTKGLSQVVNKLYSITLHERHDVPVWNKDVKFYEVYKNDDTLIGGLYIDLFQREGKMSGGWANSMVDRYQKSNGVIQLPVGLIVMNFRPPTNGEDALLSLQEVLYLFHEFGHNTQKLLTTVNARDVSGTEGVPWDGVELASQFMENFVFQPEVLDMISSHYKTSEKLPYAFLEKILEMRKFGKGMRMTGGLVLSIFEFRLHMEYKPGDTGMTERLYSDTYKNTSLTSMQPWMSTYPNSFLHVFAGGYAAGYYSYNWAEELSADDFSMFINTDGKIDWSVGKKFEDEVLSRGGSRPFEVSNEAFLGRKPTVDALMRQYGFIR